VCVEGEVTLNSSLFNLLRSGGYILYTKHGEATVGEDQANLNFYYCITQRNLSEVGRRQAIYYGQLFRMLGIPVCYPILTSPFCRAIETGQLAFGKENVQIDPFLYQIYRLSGNLPNVEQKRILDYLRFQLEIAPVKGSNKVIISHSFPQEIGLGKIFDMGTVVIKPLGRNKGYEIIAKLSLEDLANLSR
jgi:phosphohistidine phosphatase SixA